MTSLRVTIIECQTCGDVLRRLTPDEAQRVADRPDRFVLDCDRCIRERLHDSQSHDGQREVAP